MIYDPDRTFKPLRTQKPDIDPETQAIYKSKKMVLSHLFGVLERLKPEQKKYYEDMQLFCDGYEAGQIKDWRTFFMTAEKLREKYRAE